MNYTFLLFVGFLILAALIQVTLIPISLGLLLILFWAWQKDVERAILLVAVFSVVLGSLSVVSIWLIFLSTSVSLYLFVVFRSYLPSRTALNFGLVIILVLFWELSLVTLGNLTNLL